MNYSSNEIPAEIAGLLNLGVALGETHAFGAVSGRTAAAQAACLQRLRDEKLFQQLESKWEEFCPKYLGISRAEADKRIRLYQEFGASYFELAALTRVSAETYRAIAPCVKDGAIHIAGEVILMNAENSRRVTAAVAQLRRELPAKSAPPSQPSARGAAARIDDLRERIVALTRELQEIAHAERNGDKWGRIAAIVDVLNAEVASVTSGVR
jgi:hypothetical protein